MGERVPDGGNNLGQLLTTTNLTDEGAIRALMEYLGEKFPRQGEVSRDQGASRAGALIAELRASAAELMEFRVNPGQGFDNGTFIFVTSEGTLVLMQGTGGCFDLMRFSAKGETAVLRKAVVSILRGGELMLFYSREGGTGRMKTAPICAAFRTLPKGVDR